MRTSQLESSGDRFLSLCLQYALGESWLSPADLLEEFPPAVLMAALESDDALRSRLLVEAAGVHERIAPKKSLSAAAEDLQIALDEGICTPENVLTLVTADDFVRYLDSGAIWNVLTRGQFWLENDENSKARMLAMLETGIDEKLMDASGLLNSLSPEQLAKDLPRELLELVATMSIQSGLEGTSLDPDTLLEIISLPTLLDHISLAHIWNTTISSEIVPQAGLGDGSASAPGKRTTLSELKSRSKKKMKRPKAGPEAELGAGSTPPPSRSGGEAEILARARAIEKLSSLDRRPKHADELRTPVLLGLEAMYGDLLKAPADDTRQELFEDGFPNPAMLNEALIAMAVTLDPRLTKEELETKGADNDSLIQLILFEERRRATRSSSAPLVSPPPPVGAAAAAAPPAPPVGISPIAVPSVPLAAAIPAKRAATAPPPLPEQARRASAPPPPLPNQNRNRTP